MKFVNPKNDVAFRKDFGLTAYEYRGMRIQDERGALVQAREEGRVEGHETGLTEGRQAEKIEMARKMLQEGLDLALIAKVTGLSDIEQLLKP